MIDLKNLTVDEYTSPCPHSASPSTSLNEIIDMMEKEGIRHMPVVDNNKAVGMITQRDIKMISNLDFAKKYTAADLMIEHPYCVQEGSTLEEVALEMSRRKIGSAIVNDKNGEIVGIFTSTDGLNALVEVIRGEID